MKRRPRHTRDGIELPRVDGRTLAARRFRSLCEAFAAELGGDLSETELALVKQAAMLTLRAEKLQADVVAGLDVDGDALVRLSSEARRVLNSIRSKAERNRPAGPTLAEWLASQATRPAGEAEAESE